jgi:hypothetical protein
VVEYDELICPPDHEEDTYKLPVVIFTQLESPIPPISLYSDASSEQNTVIPTYLHDEEIYPPEYKEDVYKLAVLTRTDFKSAGLADVIFNPSMIDIGIT